ncbi:MAG: hypothetical protein KIT80_21815 [Chitinophagaceae bacterium]|nr:hypothetical protein [Chitinophagaceae bacterium]MCW5929573.1 hypothetical protein [Chitinophagaceae bacterium]
MKKLFVFPAAILILAASCKKDNAPAEQFSNQRDAEKMTAFFEKYAGKQESFSVEVSTGGTITTSKGTKIIFPGGAFATPAGGAVTGSVTVKVTDVFEVTDMILNNKPTLTVSGEQLISFGEIRVDAEQDGQPLALARNNNGVQVVFPIGAGAGQGELKEIPLWDGIEPETGIQEISGHNHENQVTTTTQTYYTYPGITWEQIASAATASATETSFRLDSLGTWRNCDILVGDPRPKTTVLCYLGEHFNNQTGTNYSGTEPSSVYFKLKNENTLIKLYNIILNPVAGKEGFLSYQNSFPIGAEGSFLAISAKDDKFYAQIKDITINPVSGNNYFGIQFEMQEVSESQLIGLINDMKNK